MPDSDGGAGLRSRLFALPARWLVALAVAAALGASGLFGGLDRVDTGKIATVGLGALDRGEPWNVTVTGARLLTDQPPLHAAEAGDRWLAIVATVEVTDERTRGDLANILRVSGAEHLRTVAPGTVLLTRDYTPAQLHPGLPEKVAFFWEQPASAAVPTRVTVRIIGKTRRADSLSGHRGWFDPAVRAEVAAPVEDRRG